MRAEPAYQEEYVRQEIINGEVYLMSSPNKKHIRVNSNIDHIFDDYLDGKTCEFFNQFNVYLSEKDHFIPDEIIVCDPDIIEEKGVYGVPDLVVEILSKSTSRQDKNYKFFKYETYGVKEYWIVDPYIKTVDVYLLKDGKFHHDNTYQFYTDEEFNDLTERQKAEAIFEIKVSLYDDFIVQLKDIFKHVT